MSCQHGRDPELCPHCLGLLLHDAAADEAAVAAELASYRAAIDAVAALGRRVAPVVLGALVQAATAAAGPGGALAGPALARAVERMAQGAIDRLTRHDAAG